MYFDLVVLSTGFQPPRETEARRAAGIELNPYGFQDNGPFLSLRTNVPRIFACGAFTGPRDIHTGDGAHASGTAAEAMALLAGVGGTLVSESRKRSTPGERSGRGAAHRRLRLPLRDELIAATVDVAAMRDFAASLPHVVHAEDNLYTSSAEGCDKIREAIAGHDLNPVVVTACTSRTHEPCSARPAGRRGSTATFSKWPP